MTRLRLQTVSTANASTLLSAFRTLSGDDCEEIIKMPSQMDMASWISPSIILIFLDMLVSLASTLLTRWWVGQLGLTFKLVYLRGLHARRIVSSQPANVPGIFLRVSLSCRLFLLLFFPI